MLSQSGKHADQSGEIFFLCERRCQRCAFAHQQQGIQRVRAHGPVGQGFGRRLQGLENRHTCTSQHGQGTGKACGVVVPGHSANNRQVQDSRIESFAKAAIFQGQTKPQRQYAHDAQHSPAVAANQIADGQHGYREKRQGTFRTEKNISHLGHHITHQEHHDHKRYQCHDGRVQRCANEFGLERLAFFQVIGQTFQNLTKETRLFASTNNSNIDIRELTRVV